MKLLLENWRKFINESEFSGNGPLSEPIEEQVDEGQPEQKPAIATFDFDSTLALSRWDEEVGDFVYDGPHQEMINRLIDYNKEGTVVFIVTSRNREMQDEEGRWFIHTNSSTHPKKYIPEYQMAVWDFVKKHGLPVQDVVFTNGELKAEAEDGLVELGSDVHHDDDPEENAAAEKAGIKTVISDPYGDYEDLK